MNNHKHTPTPWKVGGLKTLVDPRNGGVIVTQVIETSLGEIEVLDLTNEPSHNVQLMVTAPKMLEALEYCQKVIEIARKYFPKSIKNSDRFMLENCCATVGKAIHEATGGK